MKNRKWLFRVLLVLMVWAFAELCGFVGMKIASQPNPYMSYGDYFKIRKNLLGEAEGADLPRYTPAPSLNYIPTPGYEYFDMLQHCDEGYRGPSVPLKKNDAYRILFLGGSTTYGSGVEDPDSTYPALTGKMLEQLFPERKFEIINGGAEGATSAEELTYYHFKFRYYEPDLVVLHTGGNDALTGPYNKYYQPDHTNFRNINFTIPKLSGLGKLLTRSYFFSFLSIKFYYNNLIENDNLLLQLHEQPYAHWYNRDSIDSTYISPDGFYNNINLLMQEIASDSHKVAILPFVVNTQHPFSQTHPEYITRVAEIDQKMRELNNRYNGIWIPFSGSEITNPNSWIDDCHLDAKGEYEKAVVVSKSLYNYLSTQP